MSNELQFYGTLDQTGLTVVARVYDATGAQVSTDVTCTEAGVLAIYTGDMPTAGNGVYGVRFFDGAVMLGQGEIDWDGAQERRPTNTDLTGIALTSDITALNNAPATDLTGIATATDVVTARTTITTAIDNKAVTPATDLTGIATATDVVTARTTIQNDIASIPTTDLTGLATTANVTATQNAITTAIDNKAVTPVTDLSGLATTANVTATQNVITTAIDNKAVTPTTDLTGIATASDITTAQSTTAGLISGLNDISSADVTAAVPTTAQIESALINEGDGQQLVDAMVQAIGNTNVDTLALVAAIRADIERSGGMLDVIDNKVDVIDTELESLDVTVDLSGLATTANVTATQNVITTAIDNKAVTPATDLTGIALTTDVTASQNVITTAIDNKAVTPVTDLTGIATTADVNNATPDFDLSPIQTIVDESHKWNTNRTLIDESAFTLTVFDDDGTTPLHVYDLKDRNGDPSITEIFERVPR